MHSAAGIPKSNNTRKTNTTSNILSTLSSASNAAQNINQNKNPSLFLGKNDFTCDKNDLLGRGVFGEVYSGQYQEIKVAIKCPYGGTVDEINCSIKTLQDEHRILKVIQGKKNTAAEKSGAECVMTYYGCYYTGNSQIALVMEYANAGTIGDWVYSSRSKKRKTNISFTWEAAYPMLSDILMGSYFLHSIKYSHNDFKPDNLFLFEKEGKLTCKIGDMGLAAPLGAKSRLQGTPMFLAPELLVFSHYPFTPDVTYTAQIDIYAIGCTMFEMAIKGDIYDRPEINSIKDVQDHVIVENKRDNIPDKTPKKIAHFITWCWELEDTKRPTDEQAIAQFKTGIDVISPELEVYKPKKYF